MIATFKEKEKEKEKKRRKKKKRRKRKRKGKGRQKDLERDKTKIFFDNLKQQNFQKIINFQNRPWWPSGVSRRSNLSRVAAEDPGLNPAWDFIRMNLYGP